MTDLDDLIARLNREIYAILGPEGADYSEEPVTFYIEAAAALEALRDEVARKDRLLAQAVSDFDSHTESGSEMVGDWVHEVRAALTDQ